MKSYILLNTWLRTTAKNEFEKYFFNLINNSVFGKTTEYIRNHKNAKVVRSQQKYAKYAMKPRLVPIFEEIICCRYEEHRDQDKQASVPWTSKIGPKQEANL